MPLVDTSTLDATKPTPDSRAIYNCLDACITYEVLEKVTKIHGLGSNTSHDLIYNFERGLQAPLLEMMMRGSRVDLYERDRAVSDIGREVNRLGVILEQLAFAVWDKPLRGNKRVAPSRDTMIAFFYGAMRLPEVWTSKKGVRKLSLDREALEKLEIYVYARPFIRLILRIKELEKEIETLSMGVDSDGRMRTSFNMATETGRLSSSKSTTGSGGNMQNLKKDSDDEADDNFKIRKIFISDHGWKILGVDLEQAESREVGWLHWVLLGDSKYLDACYSGDLHTYTAKIVWPDLGWTGDKDADRGIAERKFYRHFSYRDMSKRGGHLTNYYGSAFTGSRHLKIPLGTMENFQDRYATGRDAAFPAFPKWWRWVAQEIQTKQKLVTPFGRERHFFGRSGDDTTLREAIAYCPQSSTADRMNLGMWRVWKYMGKRVRLFLQVHDAIYLQYREDDNEQEIVKEVLKLIDIRLQFKGRELIIPGEAKVGWNLSNFNERTNPEGLMKYKGSDTRTRKNSLERVL